MAESAAYALRTFLGGAALAHIPGGLNAGVTGVIACDDLSSWVGATANGPTRVMINREGATPEEIEVTDVSGNNITIPAGGRGLENTDDTTHGANATIEIVMSPRDLREANKVVNALFGISGLAAGDLLYLASATSFSRLAKGTARQQLAMNAAATAPEWVASLQSLLTAQGDIVYASAANSPARLAKGTAGQLLKMNAGATAPEWGDAAAAGVGSLLDYKTIAKGANESVTASTSLQDDDHLLLAIGANQTWIYDVYLLSTINDAGDLVAGFSFPAGVTSAHFAAGALATTAVSYVGSMDGGFYTSAASTIPIGGGFVHIRLRVVNGGTAGNVRLQWAQNTSNAGATTVLAGSWMEGRRVA